MARPEAVFTIHDLGRGPGHGDLFQQPVDRYVIGERIEHLFTAVRKYTGQGTQGKGAPKAGAFVDLAFSGLR